MAKKPTMKGLGSRKSRVTTVREGMNKLIQDQCRMLRRGRETITYDG